jgi:hypothetical protein
MQQWARQLGIKCPNWDAKIESSVRPEKKNLVGGKCSPDRNGGS